MTHLWNIFFPLLQKCHSGAWFYWGSKLILICLHCLIRFKIEWHSCFCFVIQKLHFIIKIQKHYCENLNRTVFFTINGKNIVIRQFLCSVNNTSACYDEHISKVVYSSFPILTQVNNSKVRQVKYWDIKHIVCIKWKRGLYIIWDMFTIASRRIIVYVRSKA